MNIINAEKTFGIPETDSMNLVAVDIGLNFLEDGERARFQWRPLNFVPGYTSRAIFTHTRNISLFMWNGRKSCRQSTIQVRFCGDLNIRGTYPLDMFIRYHPFFNTMSIIWYGAPFSLQYPQCHSSMLHDNIVDFVDDWFGVDSFPGPPPCS